MLRRLFLQLCGVLTAGVQRLLLDDPGEPLIAEAQEFADPNGYGAYFQVPVFLYFESEQEVYLQRQAVVLALELLCFEQQPQVQTWRFEQIRHCNPRLHRRVLLEADQLRKFGSMELIVADKIGGCLLTDGTTGVQVHYQQLVYRCGPHLFGGATKLRVVSPPEQLDRTYWLDSACRRQAATACLQEALQKNPSSGLAKDCFALTFAGPECLWPAGHRATIG